MPSFVDVVHFSMAVAVFTALCEGRNRDHHDRYDDKNEHASGQPK